MSCSNTIGEYCGIGTTHEYCSITVAFGPAHSFRIGRLRYEQCHGDIAHGMTPIPSPISCSKTHDPSSRSFTLSLSFGSLFFGHASIKNSVHTRRLPPHWKPSLVRRGGPVPASREGMAHESRSKLNGGDSRCICSIAFWRIKIGMRST